MEPLPSDREHLARHVLEEATAQDDRQRDSALAAIAALVALVLTLSWWDVLPGGWTLRGLVVPHALREARERAAERAARLDLFRAETPPRGAVVFLGSSTMERFPLEVAFPGRPTVDRGIGDEPLDQLLERLPASLPPDPAGAVLYMGSVDLRRLGRSPEAVREGAERVLERLDALAPGVPVALLSVLPDRDGNAGVQGRVERTNVMLRDLCRRRAAAFVDLHGPPLRTADGRLAEDHSVDRLHLSERGYAYVTRRLLEDGGAVADRLAPEPRAALIETPPRNPQ